MKSLVEHNEERAKMYKNPSDPKPNGLGCPNCSNELFDTNPDQTLMSYPPQKRIHCEGCGHTGYRIA
jgi:hypothetical protein